MTAYYNEIDPYAAQWLRNLIDAGHIAPGVVDERSIEDVTPAELAGYTQCHFFAGIGVWSLALRRAGWPDDRSIWTGSCPCQPFSAAGKSDGFADERHLWPAWYWLIRQCRPGVLAGEQVASKAAGVWLDAVQADLEAMGYAFGALAFPSAGVGAPHIRDRTFWVGDTDDTGLEGHGGHVHGAGRPDRWTPGSARAAGGDGGLADANGTEPEQSARKGSGPEAAQGAGAFGQPDGCGELSAAGPAGPTNGFWRDADWLFCRDGKWRPVEPGTFPLVDGSAFAVGSGSSFEGKSRTGMLKAYGNAINAEAATLFLEAYMDSRDAAEGAA